MDQSQKKQRRRTVQATKSQPTSISSPPLTASLLVSKINHFKPKRNFSETFYLNARDFANEKKLIKSDLHFVLTAAQIHQRVGLAATEIGTSAAVFGHRGNSSEGSAAFNSLRFYMRSKIAFDEREKILCKVFSSKFR